MSHGVKILDCTLRDGGYVNNWEFGENNIKFIIEKLSGAHIDIVECGFYSPHKQYDANRTIYTNFNDILDIARSNADRDIACMVNYGECDLTELPVSDGSCRVNIRIAFHQKDLDKALLFCEGVQKKGYEVFVQPMNTVAYSDDDFKLLFDRCNDMNPRAVYIVDSFGSMKPDQLKRLFSLYSENLKSSICIGFHSHNNLQMSFTNSQELLRQNNGRDIIIDSSVLGMGRGAGNLCTELLTMYLNDNYGKHYGIIPILEIVDNCVAAIFARQPWGYSMPYYIASVNGCHPNYATYLANKQTIGVQAINEILASLPHEHRSHYNQEEIENLYIDYQNQAIDDAENLVRLKTLLDGREILILAPGKSISQEEILIKEYLKIHKTLVISVNFTSTSFDSDMLFYSNSKRESSIDWTNLSQKGKSIIATSNVHVDNGSAIRVNYKSLVCSKYGEADNACLMLLRLLKKIGRRRITIAGFDGFSVGRENYHSDNVQNIVNSEIITERNKNISAQLKELMQDMQIHFLTPSMYVTE